MKNTHTTKATIILEIDVDVTGVFYKEIGATYLTPPEPAYFEILKVEYEGIDITKLLDAAKYDFESMEEDIINKFN